MKKSVIILCLVSLVSNIWAGNLLKDFQSKWNDAKNVTIEKINGQDTIVMSGKERIYSKDFFAVEAGKNYNISGVFKSLGNKRSRLYYGFICYDKNKKIIYPQNSNIILGSETTLAQDCKAGDKEIIIKANKKWKKKCIVAFNAKNDFSDLPNFTARRKIINIEDNGDTMKLVLRGGLRKAYPAGTKVRAHVDTFGSYIYTAALGTKASRKWRTYSGSATLAKPGQLGWKFLRPGTAYAKLIILANYDKKGDEKLALKDLSLDVK